MGRLFKGNLGFSFFYDQPATTVIVTTSGRPSSW